MPFKFYNYWTSLENFHKTVHDIWSRPVEGNFQFQLCYKLRILKGGLKTLAKNFIGKEKLLANKAREDLMFCQRNIDSQPANSSLRDQEKILTDALLGALRIEEEAMRKKSRIQ